MLDVSFYTIPVSHFVGHFPEGPIDLKRTLRLRGRTTNQKGSSLQLEALTSQEHKAQLPLRYEPFPEQQSK
jgi:hypothetical protein